MTTLKESRLRFITPAFIAGANQNEPELRAPSIRGALRWWFRVLGGSADEERAVFGGVHGGAVASPLVIRVSKTKIVCGPEIAFSPTSDKGYLYYFAKVSGNREGVRRTAACHYIAENSECKVSFLLRSKLETKNLELLRESIEVFLQLGALGLRATRGCGCFTADEPMTREALTSLAGRLEGRGVSIRTLDCEQAWNNATKCQEALGGFLRSLRKDNDLSGKRETALGFSGGSKRQSSALRLRSVQAKEGFLPVIIYTDKACRQPSCQKCVEAATREIG